MLGGCPGDLEKGDGINSHCNISVKLVSGIFENTVLHSESINLLKTCCFLLSNTGSQSAQWYTCGHF